MISGSTFKGPTAFQVGDKNVQINVSTAPPDDPVESTARKLSDLVLKKWRDEARSREISNAPLIPVPWKANQEYSDQLRLTGVFPDESGTDVNAFTEAFLATPQRRLVITGEAGTGKTTLALMLMLTLLKKWRPGEPVPVMLSLSTWDPGGTFLDDWLSQQLGETYPGLPPDQLSTLISRQRILPVLDALDELAEPKRPEALEALNQALDGGSSMIMTCRTAAYRDTVRTAEVLRSAAVIEAGALPSAAVAEALADQATGPHADRWRPALDEVRDNPAGPLARALSTPLMIWLCKKAYHSASTRPGELADKDRYPDSRVIEEHLVGSLVPACFPSRLGPGETESTRQWPTDKAERWLGFLASAMEARSTSSLQWWDLRGIADTWLVPTVVGTTLGISAVVAAVVESLVGMPNGSSLWIGMLTALAVALGTRYVTRTRPGARAEGVETDRRLGAGMIGGLIGGLTGAVAAGIAGKHGFGYAASPVSGMPPGALIGLATGASAGFTDALAGSLAGSFASGTIHASFPGNIGFGVPAGIINGLGIGLATGLAVALRAGRKPAPRPRKWDPRAGATGGPIGGLAMGLAAWPERGPVVGIVIGLLTAVTAALPIGLPHAEVNLDYAPGPGETLRADASAFRTTACVIGLPAGTAGFIVGCFLTSPFYGTHQASSLVTIASGLRVGLAAGLVLGITFGFYHAASPRFYVANWWLALRGRAPWRLARFLEDAHQHGVLRQAGPAWEFRHELLKEHLASQAPSRPRQHGRLFRRGTLRLGPQEADGRDDTSIKM